MIKIEFPADRPDIARAMSRALLEVADGTYPKTPERVTASEIEQAMVEEVQESPKQPASLFDENGEAGTAEDVESLGTDPQTTPPADSPAGARVDEKGVAFNGAFCGEAKEPFYSSGKTKGQWKKRKGVDQADYDNWYEGELGKVGLAPEAKGDGITDDTAALQPEATVNAGAAFGAAPQAQATQEPVPTDAGSLMVWISEKQAAGLLTQDDVNEAYQVTGVNTAALFGDNAAQPIAFIHTFLSAKVSQ